MGNNIHRPNLKQLKSKMVNFIGEAKTISLEMINQQ